MAKNLDSQESVTAAEVIAADINQDAKAKSENTSGRRKNTYKVNIMASRGVNKVILVGNLGADPEVRYTQNSVAIATLSIATSEAWKDKTTGEPREITEWHRCVAHRRLAEICGQYLKKGSKVYVEGRLQTRKWTDQNNVERYSTEIIVGELQMLDSRSSEQNQDYRGHAGSNQPNPTYAQGTNAQQPNPRNQQPQQQQGQPFVPDGDFDDDIPF